MTSEDLQKRLSSNIKKNRKLLGYSQEKLAEKADLSVQMVNDIEGCRRWPSDKSLTKIANALQIDVQELFRAEEKKVSEEKISLSVKRQIVDELKAVFDASLKNYLEEESQSI